jgi:hypothetical protein
MPVRERVHRWQLGPVGELRVIARCAAELFANAWVALVEQRGRRYIQCLHLTEKAGERREVAAARSMSGRTFRFRPLGSSAIALVRST